MHESRRSEMLVFELLLLRQITIADAGTIVALHLLHCLLRSDDLRLLHGHVVNGRRAGWQKGILLLRWPAHERSCALCWHPQEPRHTLTSN